MSQIPTDGTPPANPPPEPHPDGQANTTPIPTQIVERALTKFAEANPNAGTAVNRLRPVLLSDASPNADAILEALRPADATDEAP
jgi:hypothetical protein